MEEKKQTDKKKKEPAVPHHYEIASCSVVADDCINCKKCVRKCTFLKKYCEKSPKDLAEFLGEGGYRDKPVIPYSCNVCGLCEEVCIKDLDIGAMVMDVRRKMVQEGLGPLPSHKAVLSNQRWGTSDHFTLAVAGNNTGRCKRVLFPGCSMPGYSPDIVIKLYAYLQERLPHTGIVLNCCGEPTNLLGDTEGFQRIMNKTLDQIRGLGAEEVIFICPDCYHTFKKLDTGLKLTTVYPIITQLGIPEPQERNEGKVYAIHDSCITRHESELQESVREIVKSLGYEIEELEHSREVTKCCGAGGMAFHADRELVVDLVKTRAEESNLDYITYCAGCRMTFAFVKKPVLHLLDLLFSSDLEKIKIKPPPNPLVKWWNRWRLKKHFMKK